MKKQSNWQKNTIKNTLLSLGFPFFLSSVSNATPLEHVQVSNQALLPEIELQISQTPSTCYQVTIEDGMYVREEPTIFSEALDVLLFRERVSIAPGSTEDWLSISAPTPGYVWADWLAPC